MKANLLTALGLLTLVSCGDSNSSNENNEQTLQLSVPSQLTAPENQLLQINVTTNPADTDIHLRVEQVSGITIDDLTISDNKIEFTPANITSNEETITLRIIAFDTQGNSGVQEVDILITNVPDVTPQFILAESNITAFAKETISLDCELDGFDLQTTMFEISPQTGFIVKDIDLGNCPIEFKLPQATIEETMQVIIKVSDADQNTASQTVNINLLPLPKLNDTGITTCVSNSSESQDSSFGLDCKNSEVTGQYVIPKGQDGQKGIAAKQYSAEKFGGFIFTKLDAEGNELPESAVDWACVKDEITGLIWEAKSLGNDLLSVKNTYTWFEPDNTKNAGIKGVKNGGICNGSLCDTHAYVEAINTIELCNRTNWALPTVPELLGIVDYSRTSPALNGNYFETLETSIAHVYWTNNPVVPTEIFSGLVKTVIFRDGFVNFAQPSEAISVRLVSAPESK